METSAQKQDGKNVKNVKKVKIRPSGRKLNQNSFKLGANTKTLKNNTGWFHTDYEDKRKDKMTTSILYMNTNNGGTKFEDGTFVNSLANRMVTFDCLTKHAPVSCTDKDRRIVVNINYYVVK